jgi:Tfp pilus assembly protein PilW
MNLDFMPHRFAVGLFARRCRALTLIETLVTMSIFSLVVIAFIYAQMFGMRQDQLIQSKLGASDNSRRGFDEMANDIRAAKIWSVGNGSEGGFTPVPNGNPQVGNALEIYTTTDRNAYIRYYFDTDAGELYRVRSGEAVPTRIAQYLTNSMYFRAEDYRGNVQTTLNHKGVINVMLQFYQYQFPLTRVGTNFYYDYYGLQFRVTPHVPDGQ